MTLPNGAGKQEYEGSGAPEGVVLNYRNMPGVDTSFEGTTINPVRGNLPASYSSAANIPSSIVVEQKGDYVTAIEDQGWTGTCWAHSAINGAESSYIKANGLSGISSGIDWNEYHLVYYFWNTPQDPLGLWGGDSVYNVSGSDDLMVGGNSLFTFHALANWIGASADSEFDEYDVLDHTGYDNTEFAFNTASHMENGYILTLPTTYYGFSWTDMDVVKEMIMNYGAVDISYCAAHQDNYWKDNMYQYCDVAYVSNHAVSIVGWNDNIPADAFGITAPGPGAWLVKNSWGDWWGQGGYFWLSYYDASLEANAFAYDFTSADTYDNNYQYDGGVYPVGGYSSSGSITGANVFVADSDETIEAIGIYTYENNTSYEISIYTDLGATALPDQGTLATTQSGVQTYAGYHTIDLSNVVTVSAGERYAVVLTETNPDGYAWMAADATYYGGWIDSYSYAKEGESYLHDSYYGWEDINLGNTYYADGINLRIKAFTNEGSVESTPGTWEQDEKGWKFLKEDGNYAKGCWIVIEGEWYAFDENGYRREGWFMDGSSWYYFSPESGIMATGWVNDGGTWYYMHENGAMATGWVNDGGTWYYMHGSGAMATGWVNDGGTWYYMHGSGAMAIGWVNDGGTWYYMRSNGAMVTGWVSDGGTWYYMHGNGAMATGWVYYNGDWYYMHGSGAMAIGWIQCNGDWYYLYSSGEMAHNTWIGNYYVNGNGVWVKTRR